MLAAWGPLRLERRRQVRAEIEQQDRAEGGQTEAGTEVPDGLGDAGRLAVGEVPARLTASVLAGPSIIPSPAPATTTQILCWSKDRVWTLEGPDAQTDGGQGTPQHDGAFGPLHGRACARRPGP